jgi:hypothetical protein
MQKHWPLAWTAFIGHITASASTQAPPSLFGT